MSGRRRIRVILWFDTEDYLLPAADDAALRLATFLSGEGIRRVFKLVGEKARVLRRRGRRDLKKRGGGVASVVYHPCEFVHRRFWDAVNFANGANPPREAWKRPPEKSRHAAATGFANFENYVRG